MQHLARLLYHAREKLEGLGHEAILHAGLKAGRFLVSLLVAGTRGFIRRPSPLAVTEAAVCQVENAVSGALERLNCFVPARPRVVACKVGRWPSHGHIGRLNNRVRL